MKPALEAIARNISELGIHINLVSGAASPRFGYSIGLLESIGSELVLAGAAFYSANDVKRIIEEIADFVKTGGSIDKAIKVKGLGSFTLRNVCHEWSKTLLLGVFDYYKGRKVNALQIIPDKRHCTLDIPNLSVPWSVTSEPVWRFLFEKWPYSVPRKSIAATNLDVLRGKRITNAARWEDDLWEIFAGAVSKKSLRPVPLGVVLGIDETLAAAVDLAVGKGIIRGERKGPWKPWGGED